MALSRSAGKIRLGSGGGDAHAGAIKDEGLDFGFAALRGELPAIQQETYAGRVTHFYDDLLAGANGGVSGGDEGFLTYGLAVGGDRDPAVFRGADGEGEGWRVDCSGVRATGGGRG